MAREAKKRAHRERSKFLVTRDTKAQSIKEALVLRWEEIKFRVQASALLYEAEA